MSSGLKALQTAGIFSGAVVYCIALLGLVGGWFVFLPTVGLLWMMGWLH
jgi:hypothetical protein